ncbi:MAG: universal stress protein [Phycisphaerales bacterium]|jgi:nucleotide-binding universal stress UspA family protein|nr:universal stress protein [Phycisphaerales bacterium]
MYERILITLDTTGADQTILSHIRPLAKAFKSRLVLLHVADGWAAQVHGADAVSPEVTEDRAYLEKIKKELQEEGFEVEAHLAFGDPAKEIIKWVEKDHCDLIAMSTHGHRFIGDIVFGVTAHTVQHRVNVPVLLVRVKA